MGRTDVLSFVFGYFLLVVFIWGYSIGFYYSELKFPLDGSGSMDIEGEDDTEPNPLSWKNIGLLSEGQEFYYNVELPKKSITISYEIVREMRAGFLVKGNSRSYSLEKEKGIIPTINERLTEENFFVVKETGGPKTRTYTSSFWNTGLCHPPKSYFYGESLVLDSSWDVVLGENERANVRVVGPATELDRKCFACVVDDNGAENGVTICRDLPLVTEYSGEWCRGGSSMKMTLEDYSL